MAKTITRQTLNLFGNAGASTNFAEFGSQAAGAPVKTKNIATIQALAAYAQGWQNAVALGNAPYLEDMNSLFYLLAYQIVYGFQEGIAEYDSGTTYYIGSVVKNPSTFELYGSLTDSNTGNALGAQVTNTNWQYLGKLSDFQNLQASFPNLAINGGMEIWNRGDSFSNPVAGAFTADRWQIDKGTTSVNASMDVSRNSLNADSIGTYCLDMNITSIGTGAQSLSIVQFVPNYLDFKGKTVTVTMRVKTTLTGIHIELYDGIGGVVTSSPNHSGGGAYETLTVTRTLNVAATSFRIYVGLPSQAPTQTGHIYVDNVMAVGGTSASAFNPEDPTIGNIRTMDIVGIQTALRNILTNPGYEIWQRATSFSFSSSGSGPVGTYTADRWFNAFWTASGTPAWTITRDATNIDSGSIYALAFNLTTIGGPVNDARMVIQNVENPSTYNGKTLTLSVRVKTSSNHVVVSIGDDSANYQSVAHPGDGAWHTLTVTATVNSPTLLRAAVGFDAGTNAVVGSYYIDNAIMSPTSPMKGSKKCAF